MKRKMSVTFALLAILTVAGLVLLNLAPAPTASGLTPTLDPPASNCPPTPECGYGEGSPTGNSYDCVEESTNCYFFCDEYLRSDGSRCWYCING